MLSYAVIMAGGTGTRLWPLSRFDRPKQSLPLIGDETMFQSTVNRIRPLFPPERILVIANRRHAEILSEQELDIPKRNFIIEPEGRGTAACIALAAVHINRASAEAVMVILTADHYISNTNRFSEAIFKAIKVAERGGLVTLGIVPSYPSTAYGYIKRGRLIDSSEPSIYRVERFIEKPDKAKAVSMLEEGVYSWNSGMFAWRVDIIMNEFKRQMPFLYKQITLIGDDIGKTSYEKTLTDNWSQIPKQTIDYGVMEGAEDVSVIPVDFGWRDIGSWSALREVLALDEQGNVVKGDHIGLDTHNSLVYGGKRLIATIGISDMIIVDTDDALLICPLKSDQRVRELVEQLKRKKQEYL
jgi:mannose-1-phosphate guanylyltransferase